MYLFMLRSPRFVLPAVILCTYNKQTILNDGTAFEKNNVMKLVRSSRYSSVLWSTLLSILIISMLLISRLMIATISIDRLYVQSNVDADIANERRLTIARNKLTSLNKLSTATTNIVDVSIVIIATQRRNGYYLTQTVVQLIEQAIDTDLAITSIVCNVNRDGVFDELTTIAHLIDIVNIYQQKSSAIDDNERLEWEKDDYVNCLNLSSNSRYVLMLEDDALVVPQFFTYVHSIMDQLDADDSIAYVKCYHPRHLRHLWMIQCAALAILLAFIHSANNYYMLLLHSIGYYLLIYYVLTHQFLIDIRYAITHSIYLSHPESCCTPIVLFSRRHISTIIDYMSTRVAHVGYAKDHILDESISQMGTGIRALMTDNNLVVHIGKYSTLRSAPVHIDSIR